jgi:hypothetical protein
VSDAGNLKAQKIQLYVSSSIMSKYRTTHF